MALIDKLGELAKNVGDKTSGLIESSRLLGRARSQESTVAELKKELGQYFYEQYLNGETFDEEAMGRCADIKAGEDAVAEIYAELQRRKAESARPAAAEPSACQSCGGSLPEGACYCPHCGVQVEVPAKVFCPQCGHETDADDCYCSQCGAKIQEDDEHEQDD